MFGYRRTSLFITLCIFLVSSYVLYSLIDSTTENANETGNEDQENVKRLENKLEALEFEAKRNEEMLGQIQQRLYWKFVNTASHMPRPVVMDKRPPTLEARVTEQGGYLIRSQLKEKPTRPFAHLRPASFEKQSALICKGTADENATVIHNGVQMLDLYEKLSFDNPDGGVWKQGWEVKYDPNKSGLNGPTLKVFVVPHSHTDPGWVKTFDQYYASSVQGIFDSMVEFLSRTPKAKFISIHNTVDITNSVEDCEIVMRIVSSVGNDDQEFFTDLNGLQMIKRKYFKKLPLQGNFYPMPSAAFIENHRFRLTLLSGQPGAVASLNPGSLEVMLDRRTHLDDQRGVGQSMTDNIAFTNRFSLLLETGGPQTNKQARLGYLTMLGFHQSMALLYPIFYMYSKDGQDVDFRGYSKLMRTDFPCDYHIVNFRSVEAKSAVDSERPVEKHLNQSVLILHRPMLTCRGSHESRMQCGLPSNSKLTALSMFGDRVKLIEETSLTMLHLKNKLSAETPIALNPMDIKSYRLTWQ